MMFRSRRPVVAVLDVVGEIDFALSQELLNVMREAVSKYVVGVLIVQINSTGGSIAAAQQLCEAIDALRASGTMVIACCGDVAKSAALYLAASGDLLLAQAGTMTGSVGAVMNHYSWTELCERIGIRSLVIASGSFKDPTRLGSDPSEGELSLVRAVVDDVSEQFLDWLKARRSIGDDGLKALADGRILTGRAALSFGLVDEIGGLWRALTAAADHLGTQTPTIVRLTVSRAPLPWYVALLPKQAHALVAHLRRGY